MQYFQISSFDTKGSENAFWISVNEDSSTYKHKILNIQQLVMELLYK